MCYHKPGGSDLMKIELPQVQTQNGTKDSGLFAIAFSYENASGNTNLICSVRFNQRKMRDHLIKYVLKSKKMEAFPKSTFGIKKNPSKTDTRIITVRLFVWQSVQCN